MTSHRTIMVNLATAIKNTATIAAYCKTHFGRALAINVGAYANGIPDESFSPFLWVHAAGDENEQIGAADGSLVVRLVVAGCVKGSGGERYIENVVAERTDDANGLTVNGGNAVVEDLRDAIIAVIRSANVGAFPIRIRREENDISHMPLEWAVIYVEYNEPEALS